MGDSFLFVAAAALRLARFNIQTVAAPDKRYFVGMPSPAAASVPAATVFAWPYQIQDFTMALLVVPVVLVPAVLMVSTVRFRSFKDLNLGWRRSYVPLFLVVLVVAAARPSRASCLAVCAYAYLILGVRRHGRSQDAPAPALPPSPSPAPALALHRDPFRRSTRRLRFAIGRPRPCRWLCVE